MSSDVMITENFYNTIKAIFEFILPNTILTTNKKLKSDSIIFLVSSSKILFLFHFIFEPNDIAILTKN